MAGEDAADEQGTAGVDEVAYAASTTVDRAAVLNADWAACAGLADAGPAGAAYVVRAGAAGVPSTVKPDGEPAPETDDVVVVAAEATGPAEGGRGQVGVDSAPVAFVTADPGTGREALGKPVCEGRLPW